MSKKKRYIITFEDGSFSEATNVLGVKNADVKDAVDLLATEHELSESDVIVYETTEQASCTLTAAQMKKLENDKRVLSIEEDVMMHALFEEDLDFMESDLDEEFDFQQVLDQEMDFDSIEEGEGNSYEEGYQAAYKNFMESMSSYYTNFTPNPFPPFPPLPVPPFPFPIPNPRPPFGRLPWPPVVWPPVRRKQPTPWNIKLVKADRAWRRATGVGVKVAVLDTGIANHRDLRINGGVSFVSGVTSYNDGHGHGTHCAGVIGARNNRIGVVGVAPHAKLYGVKVLSDGGSGRTSWILAGLEWCVRNRMDVASLSLGAATGVRNSYTIAIRRCRAAGVTVVCASGNSFRGAFKFVNSPANSPGAVAVGAIDKNCVIAPFSSRGGTANQVTISAPGVRVNSTHLNNGYRSMSGTSMACPHVAGAAALVKQLHRNWTPAQIANKLRSTASDLGVPGNDPTYGAGLLNCDRATR